MKSPAAPLPLFEFVATVIALVMTVAATFLAAYGYLQPVLPDRPDLIFQCVIIFFMLSALLLGNVVYQISRFGAFLRLQNIMPVSRQTLEEIYESPHIPSLCVLIPFSL